MCPCHSTPHDPASNPASQAADRGRRLSELRRSNAAGLHGKRRRDRQNTNRRAIAADYRAG
jgi:hypothetical protein